jgi:hypothetical protein
MKNQGLQTNNGIDGLDFVKSVDSRVFFTKDWLSEDQINYEVLD